ncbi:MAG TPA: MarR family transcriptional regulator [Thermomicrobiales bacterium]|jgi:DNA-binding MarR family transcriptional regulator
MVATVVDTMRSNGVMRDSSESTAVATAQALLHVVPRLNRWAEAHALQSDRGGDLSLRQLSALSVIEDETTTLGDVARRLMVTPAVVTGLIDRLERRGYVRRVSGGSDRRRVHLALTEEGRAASGFVQDQLVGELARRVASYGSEDIRSLERGLDVLARLATDLESMAPTTHD